MVQWSVVGTNMGYVDFHCHLDFSDFEENREDIISACGAAGFYKLVTIADPSEAGSVEKTAAIVREHPMVLGMGAVHPHNADGYSPEIEDRLKAFLRGDGIIAVGETGLDFHYNHSSEQNQKTAFIKHIELAESLNLPLIIHSRNAEKDVLDILDRYHPRFPVVFHCYTGSLQDAEKIIDRGFSISVSGIVTFKKADFLREIVEMIPLQQLFTETDSPFLSPEPFRGKTNSPERIPIIAEKIARIKGIEVEDLNRKICENLDRLIAFKQRS